MKFRGPAFRSWTAPTESTTVTGLIAHPHRALPPGKEWSAHNGTRARTRRLRQQARALRKQYRSDSVVGVDAESGALLLDLPGPTRILPQE